MTEKITYDDTVVKMMIYPAVAFLVFGTLVGTFIAFNGFVIPDYFSGEYVTFGRVRPMHVSSVALLWLLGADLGLIFYFVPRLCGRSLWGPKIAITGVCIWWFSTILGSFSFPFGTNSGWEYAEQPMWLGYIPIKFLITVAIVLFAVSIFMTIFTRKIRMMYVSLWYTMATLIWTAFTWIAGNFGVNWVAEGITRVNVNFFYVHNLVGLIFTPMGLASTYYFLPKLANRPIYSHKLSMIGFWTIAFFYAWVGAHHIIHGPMSQWLQTVSIVFSIWLFIPVWTVVTNLFGTIKDHWNAYSQSAPLRFIIMGTFFYLMVCIQGPVMALRNVNEITSKTDWVIGHAHLALYGTFTFFAIAGVYWVVPVLAKRPIWSTKLANWHFTLSTLGGVIMFMVLFFGGFRQGLQWSNWATGDTYAQFQNQLSHLPFLQTIADQFHVWGVRATSGLIITAASVIFGINILNTVMIPWKEEDQKAAKV